MNNIEQTAYVDAIDLIQHLLYCSMKQRDQTCFCVFNSNKIVDII